MRHHHAGNHNHLRARLPHRPAQQQRVKKKQQPLRNQQKRANQTLNPQHNPQPATPQPAQNVKNSPNSHPVRLLSPSLLPSLLTQPHRRQSIQTTPLPPRPPHPFCLIPAPKSPLYNRLEPLHLRSKTRAQAPGASIPATQAIRLGAGKNAW